jgi:hypothetical protein
VEQSAEVEHAAVSRDQRMAAGLRIGMIRSGAGERRRAAAVGNKSAVTSDEEGS